MENFKIDLTKNQKSSDFSIMGKIHDYHEMIREHEKRGLNVLLKSPMTSANAREVVVKERNSGKEIKTLMFGSNNYLGAITHPYVIAKTLEATQKYGIGSGGVPILAGTTKYHTDLEKKLSELTGFEDTMLFSSGFTANLGIILGIIRPQNLIIQDKLNHASLIDGALMSGAKMVRYRHNDMKALEKLLSSNQEEYPNGMIVITDGVFSMDGDIANISKILELTQKYNAILLIDEAHATGVIGEKGAGTLSYYGITQRDNIIVSGTLSKALGSIGGYISASKEIIDYLRIYARSNLYSTSLPPSVCASALAAIEMMQTTDALSKQQKNAAYMVQKLRENGYNTLNTVTSVIPIIVGDEYKLTQMSKDLLDRGIYVSCIFPPAVPKNTARIRVNMNPLVTEEDIDYFIEQLNEIFQIYQLDRFVKV